jgi:hypothetical protein
MNKESIQKLIGSKIMIMTIHTFLVSILLLIVVTTIFGILAYRDVEAFKIKGDGFGNNGARFKSFVVCPDGKKHFFDGGSYLQLNVTGGNINEHGSVSGQFIIKYYDGIGNIEHESGFFSNGALSQSSYILRGIETNNTICHNIPKITLIFSGLCGNNVNINYASDNKKILSGSTSPNFMQASSFFGSKVLCTGE